MGWSRGELECQKREKKQKFSLISAAAPGSFGGARGISSARGGPDFRGWGPESSRSPESPRPESFQVLQQFYTEREPSLQPDP